MVLGPKNLNHMNEMNYFSTYSYCTELRKKKSHDQPSQCAPSVASLGKGSMTLARLCPVLNRKSANFPICIILWPKERRLCVVKAANEKTFCERNVPLSHLIQRWRLLGMKHSSRGGLRQVLPTCAKTRRRSWKSLSYV